MEAGDGSRVQESRGRAGEARGASATGGGVSGSDALELARLRARERQLQAVAELGFEALGAPPFAALIDRAVHSVARALAVEIVAIEELLGDGDLVVHAAVGVGEDALGRQHAGAGEGSQAGYTVITGDLLTEARFRPAAVLTRSAARSSVSVAIGSRERPWGVLLAASSRERRFSEDDVVFLHGVANVLAMAWQRADTERTVRVSEELLRGGFEHSPIGMVLANLDGTFNRVNLAFARMLGYGHPDELVGVSATALTHPEDRREDLVGIQAMLEQRLPYSGEKRYVRADGEVVHALAGSTAVRDQRGEALMFFTQVKDITESKRAEALLHESQARLQSILDNARR
jgi:PAS domain S-box-containing protein